MKLIVAKVPISATSQIGKRNGIQRIGDALMNMSKGLSAITPKGVGFEYR